MAFFAGPADVHAQSVPAAVSGLWTVVAVAPAPWAATHPPDRRMVGTSIAFHDDRMAGPSAFACGGAKYEVVQSEPRGLFQGGLSDSTAERDAQALGIPRLTTTYRVNCDTGSFDFHASGDDLVIGYDNQILRLRRAAK
jgi:hypothetical protein